MTDVRTRLNAGIAVAGREWLYEALPAASSTSRTVKSPLRSASIRVSSAASDRSGSAAFPATSGTPLALAPEVLEGAPPTRRSDIWSLGTLLYRLATGDHPVTAASLAELRRRHDHERIPPLRSRRPDLPRRLAGAIDRAVARRPDARFASAADLARALGGGTRRTGRWRRAVAIAAMIAGVAIAAQFGRQTAGSPPVIPSVLDEVTLVRTRGDGPAEPLAEGALIRPGDTLGLDLTLAGSAHVYVLNEDRAGDAYVLFPSPETDLANPLAAGSRHRLPGGRDGIRVDWQVTGGRGEEWFLVVASPEPVRWLEEQLREVPSARSGHPVLYARLDRDDLRGVGGLIRDSSGAPPLAPELLSSIAAALRAETPQPSSLGIEFVLLYNPGR